MCLKNRCIILMPIQVLSKPLPSWNQYVCKNQASTIFHQEKMINLLETYFKFPCYYFHAFDDKENLMGILPLMLCRNFMGIETLVSLPHCVYGGIVSDNQEIFNALSEASLGLAINKKVDFLLLKSIPTNKEITYSTYFHFRKKLSPKSEDNWLEIANKKRADIRKAKKHGLTLSIHQNVGLFYQHYALSLQRLGTPILNKSYFEKLMLVLGDDCKIFTAFHQGKAIASVMVFFFKEEIMPYYAGALEEMRDLHAYDFIYWFLMEYAVEHGYCYFNFGRSRYNAGSFHYKRHWGFQAQPLDYQNWKIATQTQTEWTLHPNKAIWQLPIKIWKKLPLWVTLKMGPWIAKQLI
jgi:FemAB-related protein (PEP-CTERM system-associated)